MTTGPSTPGPDEAEVSYPITFSPDEVLLLRTALELLEDTLGRDEADELEEVRALLRRLPRVRPAD
jgi:hypothetical protein